MIDKLWLAIATFYAAGIFWVGNAFMLTPAGFWLGLTSGVLFAGVPLLLLRNYTIAGYERRLASHRPVLQSAVALKDEFMTGDGTCIKQVQNLCKDVLLMEAP